MLTFLDDGSAGVAEHFLDTSPTAPLESTDGVVEHLREFGTRSLVDKVYKKKKESDELMNCTV